MTSSNDIIFALSSGSLPSGVAIIRISGPNSITLCESLLIADVPSPRVAGLCLIMDDDEIIDKGLVIQFPGPNSFTGEDCIELHVHGGVAVVNKLLAVLGRMDGFRLAEAGEFSRRAFENGRLDLTEIEGLSDLIAAETEEQRIHSLRQANGFFRIKLEKWRDKIIRSRAFIEAELDFAEEDDVPGSVSDQVWSDVAALHKEIFGHLEGANRGETLRSGFRIALMGKPNAGKSSLLNALAQRDVAIVNEEAGTTRDALEVKLDISGYPVIITDTAGIRDTDNSIEAEGIRRANIAGDEANLILWLSEEADYSSETIPVGAVIVRSKMDELSDPVDFLSCSTRSDDGLDLLLKYLEGQLSSKLGNNDSLVGRERHRIELAKACDYLSSSLADPNIDITLRSEDLRLAGEAIGRITGHIDVEDLLDLIFSEFCIGK